MEKKFFAHHLPPDCVLAGRYRLGRVLGEGGFGITYLGWDTLLEVPVAVKEYFPSQLASRAADSLEVVRRAGMENLFEKGREQFLQEARALAKMEKLQEIVGVSGYFQENGTAYIVMEFVEGITFKALAEKRGGRIPGDELFAWVEPLLLSLGKMHRLGLIHRDISPDNLMLEDGAVRLLDMGSAREPLDDGGRTVTVLLKHSYAPLEQYLGREQGPWTDVYALCATLYFCLTGQPPPTAMDRLAGEKLLPPRKLGAGVTPSQEKALLRGMALKPRQRFQSMEELHQALYPEIRREKALLPAKKKAVFWPGILCGALALSVLLAWILRPSLDVPAEEGALSSAVQASPSLPADEKTALEGRSMAESSKAVFDQGEEGDFRAALEDDAMDSLTVQAGTRLMVRDSLTITKPVYVEPGAALALAGHTTVTGKGRLEIGGELRVETLLQLAGGGSAHIAAGGVLKANGYCWLEQGVNLVVDKDGTADVPDDTHFIVVDEEALFRNAVHVDSFSAYRQAARDHVPAIVIDGDMEIPGFGESHQMPVLISEGVTVTGAVRGEGQASSWNVDGTVLINRGTIRADLKMSDWGGRGNPVTILNYGRTEGRAYLEGAGLVLNLGEMRITYLNTWETGLCNAGTLQNSRTENEGGINIIQGCTFYNCGRCCSEGIGDAPAPIAIEQGGRLFNSGQMEFGEMGWLTNEVGAQVTSVGAMRFQAGSQLANLGDFLNAGGTVALPRDEQGEVSPGVLLGQPPREGSYWE